MTDSAISHPLARRIASLRLPGMLAAFEEQMARRDLDGMPFEDRLALPALAGDVEPRLAPSFSRSHAFAPSPAAVSASASGGPSGAGGMLPRSTEIQ